MSVIQKLQRLKAKKGFTLVELICAVAIFTLLLAAVFALFDPINRISKSIKEDSMAMVVAQAVESHISRSLQVADGLEIYWMDGATDWATAVDKAETFKAKHSDSKDNTFAIVVKQDGTTTYFYSLKVDKFPTDATLAAFKTNLQKQFEYDVLNPSAGLEAHRLFNKSFYNDVRLDFSLRIKDAGTTTTALVVLDAYRGGDLKAKVRRESITTMLNIGKTNPYTGLKYEWNDTSFENGHSADAVLIEVSSSGDYNGWKGDYLILVNNQTTT